MVVPINSNKWARHPKGAKWRNLGNRNLPQRKESDKVQILFGIFEGKTINSISLIIYNEDMRSKDYNDIKDKMD